MGFLSKVGDFIGDAVGSITGGDILGAGAGLLGGFLGRDSTREANSMNAALQREFAQHGIRWKVDDAKAAGIHPLYALGAPASMAAPSFVGDTHFPQSIVDAGQNIGRAISAGQTAPERLQSRLLEAQIEGQEIENAAKRSRLALSSGALSNPSMPMAGVDMIPSEFTAARNMQPWLERAPASPGMKQYEYPVLGTMSLPSEKAKQAIEDIMPYEWEHYYVNRVMEPMNRYVWDPMLDFIRRNVGSAVNVVDKSRWSW